MATFFTLAAPRASDDALTRALIELDRESGVDSAPTGYYALDAQLGCLMVEGVVRGKIEWKRDGSRVRIAWLASSGHARTLWRLFEQLMRDSGVTVLGGQVVLDAAELTETGVRRLNRAYEAGFSAVTWRHETPARTIIELEKTLN